MNPDFVAMLSALSAAGADFIVVGAFALAAYGNPRSTGDIALWVRPSRDLIDEQTVFQIGVAPVRIDILTGIDGVSFDAAWSRRVPVELGDVRVSVLSLEDLATNKRAAGRSKDLADLAWIEANRR
jgi:hypothetical protein